MIQKISDRQSELSIATVAIFVVGLADIIFITIWGKNLVIPALVWGITIVIAILGIIGILWRGNRLSRHEAVILVTAVVAILILFASITSGENHAVAVGLFLPIIGIYLMWFNNKVLARIIIAAALVGYTTVIVLRFNEDHYILLFTIVIETIAASEIIRVLVDRLQRETLLDSLTKVWNRRGFQRQLRIEIELAHRNATPLSLLYIDLDDFKIINDTHGHHEGDIALKQFVEKIVAEIRPRDTLSRIGGDEFVLLLPETSRHAAEILAQRLQQNSPIDWTYGISQLRENDNIDAFMSRADSRLIEEKAVRKVGR